MCVFDRFRNLFHSTSCSLLFVDLRVLFVCAIFFGLAIIGEVDLGASSPEITGVAPGKPWQQHLYRMYGFGMSRSPAADGNELVALGVNLYDYLKVKYQVDIDREYVPEYFEQIADYHELGLKVMGGMRMTVLKWTEEQITPELLSHCVRDEDGLPYPDTASGAKREIWPCVNHQDYWLGRYEECFGRWVDIGVDTVHMDVPKTPECFCDVCRSKWASYSLEHLGEAISLAAAAGSSDAVVVSNYAAFRYKSLVDFLRELHQRVDALKPDFGIDTTNHMNGKSLYFWVYGRDALDMACIELTTAKSDWFAPVGEALSSYRLALACLGPNHTAWGLSKMLIASEEAVDPGITEETSTPAEQWVEANPGEKWQRLNPSADRQRLYLAQGLSEGVMVNPQSLADHHAENWGTVPIRYHDIIGDYFNFHKEYANRFYRARSQARTVVLFSVADAMFSGNDCKYAFYGLCEALLKSHIPYDVRVLEYPDEIQADCCYDVFLIPSGECLSDAAVQYLSDLTEAGECVIAFGPVGERTEDFLLRSEPLPAGLEEIEKFDIDLAGLLTPFNEEFPFAETAEMVERVRQVAGRQVAVSDPNSDKLAVTLLADSVGMMLHLLNFNIPTYPTLPEYQQLATEVVVPANDVEITVMLPGEVNVTAVRGLSPDHVPDVNIAFNQAGDEVTFTIPQVQVWEMISIDYQQPNIGDFDRNYVVDINDLAILAGNWLDICGCENDRCDGCDIDKSGLVNFSDFAVLAQDWLEGLAYFVYGQN